MQRRSVNRRITASQDKRRGSIRYDDVDDVQPQQQPNSTLLLLLFVVYATAALVLVEAGQG